MRIDSPSYGTQVQIKNVLFDGQGDGSNIIRSVSTSHKLHLGDAKRPISTLYATNLSDGTTTKTMTEVLTKQDKLDSYSDSASVANDKLTINYKVKQQDGTYSDVPVEFSGGSNYTFTDGLTETNGEVKFNYNSLFGTIESNNTTKISADYYGIQIKNNGSIMLLES